MGYESLMPKPRKNLEGYVPSPKDQKRVMEETFAPDPKIDEIYRDFDFNGAFSKND